MGGGKEGVYPCRHWVLECSAAAGRDIRVSGLICQRGPAEGVRGGVGVAVEGRAGAVIGGAAGILRGGRARPALLLELVSPHPSPPSPPCTGAAARPPPAVAAPRPAHNEGAARAFAAAGDAAARACAARAGDTAVAERQGPGAGPGPGSGIRAGAGPALLRTGGGGRAAVERRGPGVLSERPWEWQVGGPTVRRVGGPAEDLEWLDGLCSVGCARGAVL